MRGRNGRSRPRGPWWIGLIAFPVCGMIFWPLFNAIGIVDSGGGWRSVTFGLFWGIVTGAGWTWYMRPRWDGDAE